MKLAYAGNARNLLQARKNGSVPIGPVVVSMIGDDWDVTTLHLYADMSIKTMDWRMLVNLDVWLWANVSVALDRVTEVAMQIARARPKTLFVRFEADGVVHDVQVGDGFHRPKILELPAVHEFSVCVTNNTGSKIGAALRRALLSKTNGATSL